MSHQICNPPVLFREHLSDARLYATREDMIKALFPNGAKRICEIGVAYGDLSEFMIDALQPDLFVAADLFELHQCEIVWGQRTELRFQGKSHRAYYESRIAPKVATLQILEGLSSQTLGNLSDATFDLIYIDAAHDYDGVKVDAALSAKKVRPDGTLIFNDYTMFDPFLDTPYGVVQAVNELVVETEWRVVGFSLQKHMFCDIALRRASSR